MQQGFMTNDHQVASANKTTAPQALQEGAFGVAIGKAVTNIWAWIGICLAMAAYGFAYLQLPSTVQLWLDPRLLACLIVLLGLVISMFVSALRDLLRDLFRKSPHGEDK
jgi:hypothetical protein